MSGFLYQECRRYRERSQYLEYRVAVLLQDQEDGEELAGNDSIVTGLGFNRFDGTEEVLQLNKITNDTTTLADLAKDESCTYLKSPAGIFTEVTLPVEDIMKGHEKDTLNTATISFPRMNNVDNNNDYQFSVPSTILMVQKDSLDAFFEKNKLTDNRTSYTASYNKNSTGVKNAYTFYNISNLVTAMYRNKGKSENWNKVVLVPVTLTTSTQGQYYRDYQDQSRHVTHLYPTDQGDG